MFKIDETVRVFVCPTDTVYGLSARVGDEEAIGRIKNLKGRNDNRFIILLESAEQLKDFGIRVTERQEAFLARIWPGPVTVAFDEWRAFRVPNYPKLLNLIRDIGPIISTSANKAGQPLVTDIEQAREIFGDKVDAYLDDGKLDNEPSMLVKILR